MAEDAVAVEMTVTGVWSAEVPLLIAIVHPETARLSATSAATKGTAYGRKPSRDRRPGRLCLLGVSPWLIGSTVLPQVRQGQSQGTQKPAWDSR
jgi:hypothetical protein